MDHYEVVEQLQQYDHYLIRLPFAERVDALAWRDALWRMIHVMAESREVFIRHEPEFSFGQVCVDEKEEWHVRARFSIGAKGQGKPGIVRPEPYGDVELTGFGLAPISKETQHG